MSRYSIDVSHPQTVVAGAFPAEARPGLRSEVEAGSPSGKAIIERLRTKVRFCKERINSRSIDRSARLMYDQGRVSDVSAPVEFVTSALFTASTVLLILLFV